MEIAYLLHFVTKYCWPYNDWHNVTSSSQIQTSTTLLLKTKRGEKRNAYRILVE
jgi:hypothetical protein